MLVDLAGPVAQSMYKRTTFSIASMLSMGGKQRGLGGNGDFKSAYESARLIHYIEASEPDRLSALMLEGYLKYMAARVRVEHLEPHWGVVKRIAKALLEKRRLNAKEVKQLCLGSG